MLTAMMRRGGVLFSLVGALVLGLSGPAHADTYVHLFEWKWADVARECEVFLGPKGYKGVQISPPNEHIPGSEWWARYQPVSYKLESRGGTRAQFIDMVQRCNAAGVEIYADLVINHTASLGNGGVGSGGTSWSLRNHPGLYGPQDYHQPTCTVNNYQNASNVQNCDLVGLPDLNTGSSYVQQTLANYINDLVAIGVKGFRIDASKHMSPGDIAGIRGRVSGAPYIFQEVIDLGGEAVTANQYYGNGDVTEFKYSANIGNQFKNGQLKNLSNFGESWGFMPNAYAVVFTDNHDNQRGHGAGGTNILTYKDGNLYTLANVFMLAWPYGYTQVMSSYAFTNTDAGPPGVSVHSGSTVNCFGSAWQCEHRWRPIANMVAFRKAAQGAGVSSWWDNGNNQVAFARTGRGFVVINRESGTLSRSFATTLPAGTYCNVSTGDFANGTCSGPTVTVDALGNATFSVPGMSSAAIHVNAIVSGGGGGGYAKNYNQVYFRGTANNWGTTAMALVGNHTWRVSATFGSGTSERFKFDINGDWTLNFGDTNKDGIADQSGSDILISAAGTYTITFNDSTRAYTVQLSSGGGGGGNVSVTFVCTNGQTFVGQSVYVVGSHTALGSWAPANAVVLTPSSYPTWSGTVQLPANTTIDWKCLKRDEDQPTQGIEWESGANNVVSTPASGSVTTTGGF